MKSSPFEEAEKQGPWAIIKMIGVYQLVLWGVPALGYLLFFGIITLLANITSADDSRVVMPDGHYIVVANETDGDIAVFIVGVSVEGVKESPHCKFVVDTEKIGVQTLIIRVVGYHRDGSFAGTAEHTYDLRKVKKARWDVVPGDL